MNKQQLLLELQKKIALWVKIYQKIDDKKALSSDQIIYFQKIKKELLPSTQKALQTHTQREREQGGNCSLQIVHNEYDGLYKILDQFLDEKIDTHYLLWQKHILNVGTCYAEAYRMFNHTVTEQDKYVANINSIAASVISVMGLGTMSWLSTLSQTTIIASKFSESTINIAEDIAQGTWDKAVSYAKTKNTSSKVSKDDFAKLPTAFQNQISTKALNYYLDLRQDIIKQKGIALLGQQKILEYQKNGGAKCKIEHEKFKKLEEKSISLTKKIETKLLNKVPPKLNAQELQDEFERRMWAAWLPNLKSYTTLTVRHYWPAPEGSNAPPHGSKIKIPKFDTWLDKTLKNRLRKLGIEKASGSTLTWTDNSDSMKLVTWAQKYQTSAAPKKYTF